ncbi:MULTISPECIES: sugar ABC transporter permease [unclassified Devosia]|uniref:carbohydrate ABC transporter permease n=1 Tax=unclassified Devosia TaxID=196773 RepID=UPI00145F9A96|nr:MULTISPECIES: sugar ABC transporter permease [unclassified Devosia]MBJ6985789.1 sugar ABC transporter permease [Devosia sp. MC521]MBJ7577798.1 sugar ABC transporter permease [Devosia sp. MC532]MBK1793224.1 sugar ABC transporter permease [Devosia sp. WQ 349K1]QMW61169.1 sugar ABC transporter permease [Devosia sp. MC521]
MTNQSNPWLTSNIWVLGLALLPAALLIGALLYFTAWAIAFSFTDLALVGRKSVEWSWVGLQNFERLFTRRGFLESLWTTVVFVFFSAIVGQSVLGFMLAAVLRGTRSQLRTIIEVSIMLGWLLPDIVAAFLWSATTSQTGLINQLIVVPLGFKPINFINEYALPIVTIANVWKGTAWSYLLFSAALDSVSREVVEAAKVDGATPLQRVLLVQLPIIRPHIATNMLFITIWTFTYFPLIYAMTGGGPGTQTQTLALFLYNQSFSRGNLGFGSAISVAMLIIVGVLSLFYLRLLREPK